MTTRMLCVLGVLALYLTLPVSTGDAATSGMVDVAEGLYRKATPDSFAQRCSGKGARLEVTGDRHACTKPHMTTIVHFADDAPTRVTVFKKGLHGEVVGQLKRKLGAPSSVKTLGAMKMHFWFTDRAEVSVGLQSSAKSRSTMVSFRKPS